MSNKFLQIKHYTDKNCNYFYAERLGVDSVAFILHDKQVGLYGLISEFKPPIDRFLTTAFGGSIDKDKPYEQIVREEVEEEAGYRGDLIITARGKAFVSTQMNQFCYLYHVDVTNAEKCPTIPHTEMDKLATTHWLRKRDVMASDCWKAITIIARGEPR